MNELAKNAAKQGLEKSSSKLSKLLSRFEQGQQVILVLDTSGSMSSQADTPGECRIDALRGVVEELRLKKVPFKQLIFNSTCMWSDIITEPGGGTNLASALTFCKQANAKHVIIVSDGQPDSREAALIAARNLGCKIDVFFVGPKYDTSAQDFMKKLAALSGGIADAVSFKELQAKVAGMLTAGENSEVEQKPIAL